ncbi:MAG: helix-turn-helix domain-containing protein [Actinomycetes bacterium]
MFEIGNTLREARSRRQIEFAQAEQATKIRAKYLRLLEQERFDELPSETYVKGFLRTYAEYLGLDGQVFVDEYSSRFAVDEQSERQARRARSRPKPRAKRLEAAVVLAALTAITALTVVVVGAWKTSGGGVATHRVARSITPARTAVHAYLTIAGVYGPSYVAVRRGGPTGTILFAGTVERGKTEPFTGRRFWVNVSSPENLMIRVGGRPVHVAGYRPSAITVTPTGWRAD